jgi:hypothetical protein
METPGFGSIILERLAKVIGSNGSHVGAEDDES